MSQCRRLYQSYKNLPGDGGGGGDSGGDGGGSDGGGDDGGGGGNGRGGDIGGDGGGGGRGGTEGFERAVHGRHTFTRLQKITFTVSRDSIVLN